MNYYATPHRTGIRQAAAHRSGGRVMLWLPFSLVFAALTFNFFLCFLNTNIMGISRAHIVLAEILIVGLALAVSFRSASQDQIIVVSAIVLYLLMLSAVRSVVSPDERFDFKIIRDFLIPVAFFYLGAKSGNLARSDMLVRVSALVVTGFAIFEYFFLDTYLNYFNILSYYISRGSLESDEIGWLSTTLYVSGIRPEGRSLFPFLGDHRVSAIFLEPVSPGNFAVTLFFWALVRSRFERKLYYGIFLMAILLTILADNRFGVIICAAAFVASLLSARHLRFALIFAPFVVMAALVGVAVLHPDGEVDNSFWGRILSAAYTLAKLDFWNWLGIGRTAEFATTDADSGYAYTVSRIGIFGFIAFWGLFMATRRANAQFQMFRSLCALYFVAILIVSYSPYTIKTAALLWFLLGALSVARGNFWTAARHLAVARQSAPPRNLAMRMPR